jgi:hypothetical protein
MTAWAHLPNAAVIDDILADVKARPRVWKAAYFAPVAERYDSFRTHAWAAAWVARVERNLAQSVIWAEARHAARDALIALIAWDASADLLTLTPDALRTIIDTCDGDVKHQAVLLLPAAIARSTP